MRLNDIFFGKIFRREIQKMLIFFSILSNVSIHLHKFQFMIASSYIMNSFGSTTHKIKVYDVVFYLTFSLKQYNQTTCSSRLG